MADTTTKIGKDVIESLTLGMYEDARFVFREYIQNSADQIDKAVEAGIFSSLTDGKIEIDINQIANEISISDNATGIKQNKVQAILKNIAQSTKDRTKNKGFRGIGRLGGLAYCNQLVFETSFKGEDKKSILTWDAQKLKAIINNRSLKEEAVDVIDEVTDYATEDEHIEKHYFRVALRGVNSSILLDKDSIYQYLTMVAPVPFSKGFIFKTKVEEKAKHLGFVIDEYSIFVNQNQVFKAYTTTIYEGEKTNRKKIDEVHDIETYEIRTSKNELLAWGWYSISSLIKQMPVVNSARSLRLRKGNIQIGLEDTLDRLFKDARWSKYYFGEVYAVSSDLIPNARRDYFIENPVLSEFERLLKIKFHELQQLNYLSSNIRSEKRKIDDFVSFTKEYKEKATKRGFTNDEEKKKYQNKFEVKKEKAQIAEKKLERQLVQVKEKTNEGVVAQQKIYEKLVGQSNQKIESIPKIKSNGKTKYITDSIGTLNRKEKKLVSRIFAVIDNVLPKDTATLLKDKIKEEMQ